MTGKRVVLAEYYTMEDRTLMFIIREDLDQPAVESVPLSRQALRDFLNETFSTERGGLKAIGELPAKAWQDFLHPLVEPIARWSAEDDVLWLVPHDVLHYLPLHAVEVDGRALGDRNPTCYTPSASVMKYCQERRRGRREHALVLGDPESNLPHAREEAYLVAKLFQTTPHCGSEASKELLYEQLKNDGANLDVLHFACHGHFEPSEPLKSGIRLAARDPIDPTARTATLTAEEMFGLELHADLVTLSACETGASERLSGDELIGLTRALLFAGTPSAIVSLWNVDAQSSTFFMARFYQSLLAEGDRMNKAEALRAAQRYVRDMTTQAIVADCNQRLSELHDGQDGERRMRLLQDRADAQYRSHDYAAAIATSEEALTFAGEAARREIEITLGALRFAARRSSAVDYSVRPFASAFHWAPFILVGDWL